jgi:type I restriction enzyme M protein
MNHSEVVSFLWGVADLIRDSFKRGHYQDVILPLTVLRRLDCVLAPTREAVWRANAKWKGKLENPDKQLRKASGFAFYNTSLYDFDKLLGDHAHLAKNLRNYIAGFSPNMAEVVEHFGFDNTIAELEKAKLLYKVLERFKNVDLHPGKVSNAQMGTIFEELIRKFNEALDENPGEHFTPRDVVRLMVDLLLAGDAARLKREGAVITVCDPCCGTGGMLTIAKEYIQGDGRAGVNPNAHVHLFGQEVNPQTFAVCKSDLFIKSADGGDAEHVLFGSTLSDDRHGERRFDYLIANPPYGKDWKRDQEAVEAEHERGESGRFVAGLPRISDGQLLFLQHMLSHMKPPSEGGSRVAIIMNGSPLFTGDAGGGESEIRRWILQNDWLEALVALPEQMFYNTGIATYVWVLTNRKAGERKGRVQLIDATSFWTPMRKSLGDKRREIPPDKAAEILAIHKACAESERSKIFPTAHFGYRKITVERPLRLNFEASAERMARLESQAAFQKLVESKKKLGTKAREAEEAAGRARQEEIQKLLAGLPQKLFKSRDEFVRVLEAVLDNAEITVSAPAKKAILTALSERDESAEICRDGDGNPESDPELRDYENVSLGESIEQYFAREVKPYVPDAWINTGVCDDKDDEVGKVGYEINFNRYFYKYVPPRPLQEIEAEIRKTETEVMDMLKEVAS